MRINLFAGPGAGKSRLAAKLYSSLTEFNIEIINEYVKDWAYIKRVPRSFDQVYIFGKQLHKEDLVFQSGVHHIVTDSPIMMQIAYAKKYDFPFCKNLLDIAKGFEEKHPSHNIFLNRGDIPYKELGRYETYDEARLVDEMIKNFLEEHEIPYVEYFANDYEQIIKNLKWILE